MLKVTFYGRLGIHSEHTNTIYFLSQPSFWSVCCSPASSLFSHRFVTVRRGSPAARSGQIQQGDHLEAVEGRSVLTLPHRELAQILRRAGNTLRLTIIPRTNNNSMPFYLVLFGTLGTTMLSGRKAKW